MCLGEIVGADVKICGLTRSIDAELADAAGASYLGVIFAGGPSLWDMLLVFGPTGSCVAAFAGGAVCSHLGNKRLGGWTMGISAIPAGPPFGERHIEGQDI